MGCTSRAVQLQIKAGRWPHQKLMNQISGLTRAVAYKKRVELQNKTDLEAGASDVKTMLWNAMAKERPDLYKQVSGYLDRKVQEGKP